MVSRALNFINYAIIKDQLCAYLSLRKEINLEVLPVILGVRINNYMIQDVSYFLLHIKKN
jgi:hypothetical protein